MINTMVAPSTTGSNPVDTLPSMPGPSILPSSGSSRPSSADEEIGKENVTNQEEARGGGFRYSRAHVIVAALVFAVSVGLITFFGVNQSSDIEDQAAIVGAKETTSELSTDEDDERENNASYRDTPRPSDFFQVATNKLGGKDILDVVSATSSPTLSPISSDPSPVPSIEPTAGPTWVPSGYPTNSPFKLFNYGESLYTDHEIGIQISEGLNARVLARVNQRVRYADGSVSTLRFHEALDGAGVAPLPDGGYVYVSNSENDNRRGGVFGLYFDENGEITEYKALLQGTTWNCGGKDTD